MVKRHFTPMLGCALLGLLAAGTLQAKEGGDQYPNGAETWMAGAVPPPGDYFINYTGHYGGKLRNGSGKKVSGNKVSAWFTAQRYIKVTNTKILGGDYTWHVIVPVVHQDLRLFNPPGTKSRTALGDITINPFILAWHRENLHWAVGLDINLPTGSYSSKEWRRSVGANYWSFEPLVAVTWLNNEGWEASGKFMYNIKTKNKDFRYPDAPKQKYKSGQEFHMDYLLGKRFGQWGAGISGYYLKQTTKDKVDGKNVAAMPGVWSTGRRGQVLAYGPTVSYTTTGGTMISAQWNHETKVRNRFSGDKLMLKFVTAF